MIWDVIWEDVCLRLSQIQTLKLLVNLALSIVTEVYAFCAKLARFYSYKNVFWYQNATFSGCPLRREAGPAAAEGGGEEEGDEGGQVLGQARSQEHRPVLQHLARMSAVW